MQNTSILKTINENQNHLFKKTTTCSVFGFSLSLSLCLSLSVSLSLSLSLSLSFLYSFFHRILNTISSKQEIKEMLS